MTAVVAVLGLITALLAVVVVSLLRSHADILRVLHDAGLKIDEGSASSTTTAAASTRAGGAPRPPDEGAALGAELLDIIGTSPTGDALSVSLEATPRTLLAFLSSGCLTCRELWTTADSEGQPALRGLGARLVIVGKGAAEESPAALADVQPVSAPTVMSSETWEHFGVPVSPYFVLVDGIERRVIGEGAGRSWAQVVRLLEQSLGDAGTDLPDGRPIDRRSFMTGRDRELRADRALLDAGIRPGDARLHPQLPSDPDGSMDG